MAVPVIFENQEEALMISHPQVKNIVTKVERNVFEYCYLLAELGFAGVLVGFVVVSDGLAGVFVGFVVVGDAWVGDVDGFVGIVKGLVVGLFVAP
jgi:hypothetical protein